MDDLEGKRILYIGSKFFNYEKEIQNELINLGADVDFFDQRPSTDFLTKVLIRLNLKLLIQRKIDIYYKNIVNIISSKVYDYIFLISPEAISKKNLEELKKVQPDSKVIVYMWDSVKNKLHLLNFFKLIDKVYSFDKDDCNAYKFNFLPLFYLEKYKKLSNWNDNADYDLCFIGTVHSDRYDFVMKIKNQFEERNLKTFIYFYSPSKMMFNLQKIFYKNFKNINRDDVSFVSLNSHKIISIIESSKIILDIERPNQNGLTMRNIEVFGANRKLITTNSNIKSYDIYNSHNVLIVDRKKPVLLSSFLSDKYVDSLDDIYNKYSLRNWLQSIFTTIKDEESAVNNQSGRMHG